MTDSNENNTKKPRKSMDDWWSERSIGQKILLVIGFAIAGVGFMALIGLVVMLLWNWLMPDIFGLKTVSYWQAFGLLALCTILFKGFPKAGDDSKKRERKRKHKLRGYMSEEADSGKV